MEHINRKFLSGTFVPVLLGVSPESNRTARRYFRQYGVTSHLFCDKIPLTMRLAFCIRFHMIRHTSGDRLLMDALIDFATQLDHADVILYLIPATVDHANFVWRNHIELERYYIIAGQSEMDRLWYGEEKEDAR